MTSRISPADKIVNAATRLFQERGVRSVSMSEIANEAGVARTTAYRLFSSRTALLEVVLVSRIIAATAKSRFCVDEYQSLEEALVDIPIKAKRFELEDSLCNEMKANQIELGINILSVEANESLRRHYHDIWDPIFVKARNKGELRSSLPDLRIIDGMMNIAMILDHHPEWSEAQARGFLQDFLVPAILGRNISIIDDLLSLALNLLRETEGSGTLSQTAVQNLLGRLNALSMQQV